MNVIKRDGREDRFQKGKITLAIQKASDEVEKSGMEAMPQIAIQTIATEVYNNFKAQDCAVSVENIQDAIESLLMQRGYYDVAKHISVIVMSASLLETVIRLMAKSCLLLMA